jgi:hypothetical protein
MLHGLSNHILTLVVLAACVHFSGNTARAFAPLPDSTGYENRVGDDGIKLRSRRPMAAHANQLGVELRMGKPMPGIEGKDSTTGLVYQRALYNPNLTAWNIGATVTTDIYYGAHADYQWNKFPMEYYEPVWRVGVGALFAGSEEFSTFIKMERYHARLSAGLEDLFGLGRRLRLEALVTIATGGVGYGVGLHWAFQDDELR